MADDTAGNVLGVRATFTYTTDDGEVIPFTADRSVGEAVGNDLAVNPRRPQSVNSKYLQGRYLLVQGANDPSLKKKIVIGDSSNPAFAAVRPATLLINGQSFVVTGRAGERVSFLKDSNDPVVGG